MSPTVLVVGAGPVGLTLACELARYRVGVRLIDRSPEPTRTSKALVVWSRTLELMDRMGCTEAFLAAGLRARGATLRSGGRVLGGPRFSEIASPYDFALMIPQSETERLLSEHLAGLGVAVERPVALTGFAQGPDAVEAWLRHADGREERVVAPYLIGCDGAHSSVRHGLGLAFEGQAQGDEWLLADIRIEGPGAPPPDEIAVYLHRDGPFVIFPIPGGRARVVATVGRIDPARARPEPTLAEVQALVETRAGDGIRVADPVWLTHFRIHERKVSQYRTGRAFLAGDAAHIHSPAGGQGMNTGMQDAVNLAWKLALVLRGEAAPGLLDSYGPERNAVGETVLRNATRLTDMATLAHPAAQGRPQPHPAGASRVPHRAGPHGRHHERDRDRLSRRPALRGPGGGLALAARARGRTAPRRGRGAALRALRGGRGPWRGAGRALPHPARPWNPPSPGWPAAPRAARRLRGRQRGRRGLGGRRALPRTARAPLIPMQPRRCSRVDLPTER